MPNEDISNRLKGLHFFKGMSSDELGILSEHVEMEELEPESVVFKEGDAGDSLYFISEGSLEVSMDSEWGENIKLATLEEGSSFGEMSVIDELPRSATITANTNATVISLRKGDFDRILDSHPKIGVQILKGLAQFLCTHLRKSNESLSDFLEPT